MWWRRLAEVQTEHQNGEERVFKWLWTWNTCWCQTGWTEYFKNCWSTGIFTHKHVYREWSEKEKISSERISGWWWWCNGVGDIFLAHFGPLNTNWVSFKSHSLPEYCCWPCPSFYDKQQDSAPCHKAQIISDWFLEHDNELSLLKWPPLSPDLNPIEHLWDVVEREIRIMDVQPTNLQQLRDAIMSIWTKISEECFQHLVESMPWRMKAVLKTKAGPTRY